MAKFTDPQWFYDRQYVILKLRWAIQKTNLSFTSSFGCADHEMGDYIDSINHCGCSNTDDRSSNVGCTCIMVIQVTHILWVDVKIWMSANSRKIIIADNKEALV
ncbi:Wall-associated receptor kinase protein [Raphanus sativus]|nr:Wall-associated receptor kinase protein [Raphanus sativus]KAJ4867152.1 Wall-associated receptor kinase protein [Raphanus sativus]KAJ4868394.1 Wall-associated receptor kinase protein [Raphanus sativus]